MKPHCLALIGYGALGSAMVEGWIAAKLSDKPIIALDKLPRANPHSERQLLVLSDESQFAERSAELKPSCVFVAIKPQDISETLEFITRLADKYSALIVSAAAGTRLAVFGARPAIRAMPNTAAAIQQSMTTLVANEHCSEAHTQHAVELLEAVGSVMVLDDEKKIDATTAIAGSGPAYLFLLMEAMQGAALDMGFDHDEARTLVNQTMSGAIALAADSTDSVAELRAKVTSRGGTTEAALAVLLGGDARTNMPRRVRRAIEAARRRSADLAMSSTRPSAQTQSKPEP